VLILFFSHLLNLAGLFDLTALVDVENGILHHGGNFQATSVATSMEKTRLAIAAIGKIIFAQVTELNK
jgi:histidine ammonia-lyase